MVNKRQIFNDASHWNDLLDTHNGVVIEEYVNSLYAIGPIDLQHPAKGVRTKVQRSLTEIEMTSNRVHVMSVESLEQAVASLKRTLPPIAFAAVERKVVFGFEHYIHVELSNYLQLRMFDHPFQRLLVEKRLEKLRARVRILIDDANLCPPQWPWLSIFSSPAENLEALLTYHIGCLSISPDSVNARESPVIPLIDLFILGNIPIGTLRRGSPRDSVTFLVLSK